MDGLRLLIHAAKRQLFKYRACDCDAGLQLIYILVGRLLIAGAPAL